MKTFKQFQEDAKFAIENLLLENKGFGHIVAKRKKARQRKKDLERMSPRDAKIKHLKNNPNSWLGLEHYE